MSSYSTNGPYSPLHLDASIILTREESPSSLDSENPIGRVMDGWRSCMKSLRPAELSPVRRNLERQLALREEFPVDEWRDTGLPAGAVTQFATILAQRMKWPNTSFLPNDPIRLLLVEEYDEFGAYEFFLDLRDRLGVTLTREEILEICRLDQTLEEFIREMLSKLSRKAVSGVLD